MNYMKKSCILRQIKQGFSGDGKTLSGLIKIEQYGKNLSAEVSIINFAPLVAGEYYCLLADPFGTTELLPLRGKSLFNIVSNLDVSLGFCGIVCFVKNEVLPIAYGVSGDRTYQWREILSASFPTQSKTKGAGTGEPHLDGGVATALTIDLPLEATPKEDPTTDPPLQNANDTAYVAQSEDAPLSRYDDEKVAGENYYRAEEGEEGDECEFHQEGSPNAQVESGTEIKDGQTGQNVAKNGNVESVLHPFETNPDGYYYAVKDEIESLFQKYPKDERLNGVFSCSEWVRIQEDGSPEYLVGVVYEEWKARYICYAIPAENGETPPDEIKDVCTFVPHSAFENNAGFFIIFQSAASGECIRPESL